MRRVELTKSSLVILDIDGTLLDTPHLSAWQQGLAIVLHGGSGDERELASLLPLEAYQHSVAGKARSTGARAALSHAGVNPTDELVDQLVRTKQDVFLDKMHETTLFDDADRFLRKAADLAVPLAFCTASRNAGSLLREIVARRPYGDVVIERLDPSLGELGHRGDVPRERALLNVAAVWDTAPEDCVMIDDASHGVGAALASGMDAVLVDRFGHAADGASSRKTVSSLDQIDLNLQLCVK